MLHADLDTLAQARAVLAEAAGKGADPAEALDRAGLLWFPERDHMVRSKTFGSMAEVIDLASCGQIAAEVQERSPASPLDAKRQIVAFLNKVAAK